MKLRDSLERLLWTVVAAAGGGLLAGPIISVSVWQAAAVAGLSAGVNFVSLVARSRLAALPEPGEGLPGLPVNADDGRTSPWVIVVLVVLVLVVFGFIR